MEAPDLGDTRAELCRPCKGLPEDGPAYVRLIGGLIAEQERRPELIEAFRTTILLPRRAIVLSLIECGQARGEPIFAGRGHRAALAPARIRREP